MSFFDINKKLYENYTANYNNNPHIRLYINAKTARNEQYPRSCDHL
jgi:hypothetical protein